MPDAVIENPILNSAFSEPTKHFRFSADGITNEVESSRRISSYFVPIPRARKQGGQKSFETEWTEDRIQENENINRIRARVRLWRSGNYAGVTPTTRRLLDYWRDPQREKKLFFCQIEALETAIYIAECANKFGDNWIANLLRDESDRANPGLPRICHKMATGAGKTVVMAMLIAWQTLNKIAAPQDARFSEAFLIVAPGITIKDRLRVLLPNDNDNYYRQRDLVPTDLAPQLNQARIVITNFHAFLLREKLNAPKLTKKFANPNHPDIFRETPDEMARRVCKELGSKKNIVVINDEAHHCYRRKPDEQSEALKGEERKEAEERNEEARVWVGGLEAVKSKLGIKVIYDLSATPFFLRGSGFQENMLFPWVVSDFSLIDAIESGIVKVPRVPVSDDSMVGDLPTYRDLWPRIRDDLPKKGRAAEAATGDPKLPAELQGALHTLYSNYEKAYKRWEQSDAAQRGQTPPVFIVVCSNTNVSKLVFDYISGYEKPLTGPPNQKEKERLWPSEAQRSEARTDSYSGAVSMGSAPSKQHSEVRNDPGSAVIVPGALPIFSNVKDGRWLGRPNTILVDSQQLESGESMSPEFKRAAANEIEEFKAECRARFPGKDAEKLTDEDILREVMNTVGKAGKLGEQIKCVVSVSMLTEGWDANTVTHILGVRAFGTQLLCEQVVGRGLRRTTYAPNDEGMFEPEYAEVYGVPFSFIPCSGATADPPKPKQITRVRALEERSHLEITFPRLIGYKFELPPEKLVANFKAEHRLILSTESIPTKVENAPIVGQTAIHSLEDLRSRREQEVAFWLARLTLQRFFQDDETRFENVIGGAPEANSREEASREGVAQRSRPDSNSSSGDAPESVSSPGHRSATGLQERQTPDRPHLFPQVLAITRQWLTNCVDLKDRTFKQLLLLHEPAYEATDKIYRAIVSSAPGEPTIKPILRPYDPVGSTRYVDFDTIKPTYATHPSKCHISHVVADTNSWEQKMAQTLEDMDEVLAYVKNQNLGFSIPYAIDGEQRDYYPDFIAVIDLSKSPNSSPVTRHPSLNLVIEVTGQQKRDKQAKVSTAESMWLPAVNHAATFGHWAFLQIIDPWSAELHIRTEVNRAG